MHQIQIHVIEPEALEAFVKCFFDAGVISAPQFRRDEQLLAIDNSLFQDFFERLPDWLLITIEVGCIDMSIAN